MPIAQFVDDSEFDPETKRVMNAAFEIAREALQLGDELLDQSSSLQKPGSTMLMFCVNPC
jgi:hypothetical protein